jgi:hypothetical protein
MFKWIVMLNVAIQKVPLFLPTKPTNRLVGT